MIILTDATIRCEAKDFSQHLKHELQHLPTGILPLEKGTTQGGMVDDNDISVTVLQVKMEEKTIQAKVGVFFNEIVAGCNCGDDPVSENAYAEFLISIDRSTGEAVL